jgi:phenylacetate-CoA ligase
MQRQKLRSLLAAADRECPYYRQQFHNGGIDPRTDDPFDALAALPLLNKAIIKAWRDDLTNRQVPGGPIPFNTGGSTGEPLIFFFDRRRIAFDKAARMRTHEWFGAQPGDREIYVWGAPAELRRQDCLRTVRDCLTNERLLSAFDMSDVTLRQYLETIRSYRPVSLFGYPSSLALLCEFGQAHGIQCRPERLKVVFVTGEVLDPRQRRVIEDYFDVPVANGYGSREGGFLAHECPHGSMHVTAESVILETVDAQGRRLPTGESGEIVVTHLDNYAMPFIRYRTDDVGRLVEQACPCGRGLPTMDVVSGRRTDHLVSTDGTIKHALSLIYVLREIDRVRQFRIHQARDRGVEIRLVPLPGFDDTDRRRIERGVRRQLGEDVRLWLTEVEHIEPLQSGKHRYVISEAIGAALEPAVVATS